MIGALRKAFSSMRHAAARWFFMASGRGSRYDYSRDVGSGLSASVVMAPVQWMQRAMTEAPIVVESRGKEGELIPEHPLAQLIERPNQFYSGMHLLHGTVFSLLVGGNGYWIKIRNGNARPVELWYAPHWLLEPKWPTDGSEFISHYEYRPLGEVIRLEVSDVIHFRTGMDPRNPRLGMAPLFSALKEVWSDMESATFVASLLRNMGVPGLIISPDNTDGAAISEPDVEDVKTYLRENFTGEKRGEPLVMSGRTKVDKIGFSPSELDLSAVSDRAEERVCALLGIPPSVVGFHSGNTQTKVGATMEEQIKLAWNNAVLPMQALIAEEVERSLLPDMVTQFRRQRVYFDVSEVKALQEDEDKLVARADKMIAGGWIKVSEGRQMIGMETDDTHDIYLRRFGVVEVPGDTGRQEAPTADPTRDPPGNEEDPEEDAAPKHGRKQQHRHSPLEERLAAGAPHAEPTVDQLAYLVQLEQDGRALAATWEAALIKQFEQLGVHAAAAAEPILRDALKNAKAEALDQMITERVIEALDLPGAQRLLTQSYEAHYISVARKVAEAASVIGVATDLPDLVGRAIIATGGRRAGLVDLTQQTRDRVLREVAEGRAAGEGAEAVARRIRDKVPAGPWSDSRTRARVIARTETKYAQNVSVVEHARANSVERFLVFDARLGETDEVCMMLDGAVVSADEANELASTEHPNGTRSFAPHFGG